MLISPLYKNSLDFNNAYFCATVLTTKFFIGLSTLHGNLLVNFGLSVELFVIQIAAIPVQTDGQSDLQCVMQPPKERDIIHLTRFSD